MVMKMKELQTLLKQKGIKYYIVPTDDDHQSENVGDYYQFRRYLSGFTGSAGTLIVGQEGAYLWTDGRYFIQAEKELYEGISLMKMGQAGVPTITEFLVEHLEEEDILGFDGKVMNASFILDLEDELDFDLKFDDCDLTSIWKDRPALSHEKAFLYDVSYNGQPVASKLEWVREYMDVNECDAHVIASLDDIAWLFNIRGHDIACNPTVLAFAIIKKNSATLYMQKEAYDQVMVETYATDHISIKDYHEIYDDVAKLNGTVLCDLEAINYKLYHAMACEIMDGENPSQYFKSIKNTYEITNTKNAHLKDGVAMTKFMFYLKNNICSSQETEVTLSDKLLSFRKQQDLFIEPSFETICAYKENAALMHYHATPDHCAKVTSEGMLLIDSGGQYMDGTTDITRTFVLGELSSHEKKHFTMVLKGLLALQNARFLYGATGMNLDILARFPMWQEDIDYQCGTGHGVGHLLNVHEGPNEFRPRSRNPRKQPTILEAGMITTDEPGIYLEGKYGIRHENELLCVEGTENEYGQFMHFEVLTKCPIDLDGVDENLLSDQEKSWLNTYHRDVYKSVSPYLSDEEKEWLKYYTREI